MTEYKVPLVNFKSEDTEKNIHWAAMSECGAVQDYIYDMESRVSILYGAMGTAKTVATCQKLFLAPLRLGVKKLHPIYGECRLLKVLLVRESLTAFEGTMLETLKEFFEDSMRAGRWGEKAHTPKAVYRIGEELCVLEFRAFGMVDKQKFESVRGSGYDIAIFNEFSPLRDQLDGWRMVMSRVGRPKRGTPNMKALTGSDPLRPKLFGQTIMPGRIWGDTNPPTDPPPHWFYDLFPGHSDELHEKHPDHGYCQHYPDSPGRVVYFIPDQLESKILANPSFKNSKEYYREITAGAPENVVREFARGKRASASDSMQFYPSFTRARHVVDYLPNPTLRLMAGSDSDFWGGQVIAQISEHGQLVILKGLEAANESGTQQAEKFLRTMTTDFLGYNFLEGWYDPAGQNRQSYSGHTFGDALRDVFRNADKDYKFTPAPFPGIRNDLTYRQEIVERMLNHNLSSRETEARPLLVFAREAQNVVVAMESFRRRMKNDGKTYEAKPVKDQASGLADAVAYLCIGAWEFYFSKIVKKKVAKEDFWYDPASGTHKAPDGTPVLVLSDTRARKAGQENKQQPPMETHLSEIYNGNGGV